MTWKYTCSATENTCWADMGRDFGQMVSEATGGAVTVEVFAADQLTSGNQTEGIQGVMDGTIDLSAHSNIIYSNFDKRLNVVSLPFLFSSFDDVDAKLDGDAGKAVGEVVESMGLHLLGIAENGFRHPTQSVHREAGRYEGPEAPRGRFRPAERRIRRLGRQLHQRQLVRGLHRPADRHL